MVAIFGGLAIGAAGASAAAPADPVQLGWNGVRDAGGFAERAFACDTVGGSHRVVVCFTAPDSIPRFVALDVTLELRAAGERLPAWWEFKNSESCRTLSLSLDLQPAAPADSGAEVLDPWDQGRSGIGVISGYRRDIEGEPRIARITASMARPISKPIALESGKRYWAGAFVIDSRRTLGRYACAGCSEPITIRVFQLTLYEADGRTIVLEPGARGCVGWQGAACEPSRAGTAGAGR
jgi:hypothetical protein